MYCVPTGVKYDLTINPCHAEYFHIPHPSLFFYPVNLQPIPVVSIIFNKSENCVDPDQMASPEDS